MTRLLTNLLLLSLFLANTAFSGTDTDRRWEDKSLNSSKLIVKYYRAEQMDTVRMVLQYWENECNMNEPLLRFKVLLAMQDGTFNEKLYDDRIMGFLMKYRVRVESMQEKGADAWKMRHSSSKENLPKAPFVSEAFNKLTMNMAIRRQDEFKKGDPQRFFSLFYNHEFDKALKTVQEMDYAETELQKYTKSYLENANSRLEEHYAVHSGSWMPSGNLDVLGSHPTFGVTLGLKKNRWLLDIVGELRFTKSKATYTVGSPTGIEATDKYRGGYMGLEFGREVWQNNRQEFDLLAGFGYEGFDALTGRGADQDVSPASKNINFGAGYRFFLHSFSTAYLGLQVRYALIDYDSDGGSDLSGNALTFRLSFGKARNSNKAKILQSFGK
ncbi:MAG: hypothetical protein DWQ05_22675 [Calditrichaeota bacterium]|nr:MAG: hypothetical protein DWQ05_22675 [Calditrichota bacterium]